MATAEVGGLVTSIITILLVSLAIHFGAKPFVPAQREKFLYAVIVAVVGSILASLVWIGLDGVLSSLVARIVAIAAWALVAAIVYRTSWVRGLLIGVVAWLLWFLVSLLIDNILQ